MLRCWAWISNFRMSQTIRVLYHIEISVLSITDQGILYTDIAFNIKYKIWTEHANCFIISLWLQWLCDFFQARNRSQTQWQPGLPFALIKVRERLLEQILPQRTVASSVLSPGWLKEDIVSQCVQHVECNTLLETCYGNQIHPRFSHVHYILRLSSDSYRKSPTECQSNCAIPQVSDLA